MRSGLRPAPPGPAVAAAAPAPAEGAVERRAGLVLLGGALVAGAVLRAALALGDHSVYWPDEVHKTLEPAHRLAFGYGFEAWEFAHGAVSWALPGALAGILRLLAAVGLDDPSRYVVVVRLGFAALSLAAAAATYALARRHAAPTLPAAAAAALCALAGPVLYFSHRALTETASLAPVAAGLACALPRRATRRQVAVGAGLLALAVFLRLHNAVFAAGLVATLVARRDWPRLRPAAAVLAGGAVAFGLLDRLTWGSWFHSAFEYGRFSLVERGAAEFGTAPFGYYASFLARALGPAALPAALLVAAAAVRAPALFLATAAFLLAHSFEPHKEVRFVLPALPLLCALIAVGTAVVADAWPRRRRVAQGLVAAALVVVAAASAWRHRGLTYADVGQGAMFDPTASAYFHGDSVNRLLLAAHRRADLCGLHVVPEVVVWTGGYTYLHRRVPLYGSDARPPPGAFNYAVALGGRAGQEVVAADGGLVLERLSPGPCRRDPGFSERLSRRPGPPAVPAP